MASATAESVVDLAVTTPSPLNGWALNMSVMPVTSASESVASSSPSALAASCISTVFAAIVPMISRYRLCSRAVALSCAPRTLRSCSFSSGVTNRSPVVSVWRRM